MFKKREIVSFAGRCEMNCKHCFALEQENNLESNDVEMVVDSLKDKEFDIIYVSHNKENFFKPEDGLRLCERLYETYKKDLCVTSRCVLENETFEKLVLLNKKMKSKGKRIYWCASVPAMESASIMEDLSKVPSPKERIEFLHKLKTNGICSILSVRPMFPNSVIPDEEICNLIKQSAQSVHAVITGGLITTAEIDKRLGLIQTNWKYSPNNDSDYLVGAIGKEARFVDVEDEILHLKKCCDLYGVAFFAHSMQAINYLVTKLND